MQHIPKPTGRHNRLSVARACEREAPQSADEAIAQGQIDKLRHLADQLSHEGALYREMFQSAPVGYVSLNDDGTLQHYNRAAAYSLPTTTLYPTGTPFADFLVAADAERFEQHLKAVAATHLPLSIDVSIASAGREPRPVTLTTSRPRRSHAVGHAFQITIMDLSKHRETEKRLLRTRDYLEHLASHDQLTGLPNRMKFFDRLRASMERCRRTRQRVAVLFFDIDGFKPVNDTLGHKAGDLLLCEVANRLSGLLDVDDMAARLGGDEFTALLSGELDDAGIVRKAEAIAAAIREPILLDGEEIRVSASIGVSVYPDHARSADDLVKGADLAMYRSKDAGRDRVTVYDARMRDRDTHRAELEASLRSSIENGHFSLHYQPIFNARDETISHVEALVRWHHPRLGLQMPDDFIPIAEKSGSIIQLGEWIVDAACAQAAHWNAHGLGVPIAVNVSARQLVESRFDEVVKAALSRYALAPCQLELEVTESEMMRDDGVFEAMLERLRDSGIRLSIDDLGTGYSSLSRLLDLPVTRLKIDRSVLRDVGADRDRSANAEAVVRAIIAMARQLDLDVVSEGVETRRQLDFLLANDAPLVQGFLLSRPLVADDVSALLRTDAPAANQSDGSRPPGASADAAA